ncbi:MAG: hypothetical protein QF426_01965, partial [Verrucomicrobiales bacterium]|nr:hypothetical protein [Verrucomicrobiales bacterium]
SVLTKPFRLEGSRLQINVLGENIKVDVLDENGKIIPGLTSRSGKIDSLRWEPKWTNGHGLSQLIGENVRLRFYLQNAKLFAFQFLNSKR